VSGAGGGITLIDDVSTAGNATLIANGGVNGGGGGSIQFLSNSKGGTARIELFGNGSLDISQHNGMLALGSLEGDGQVLLGANKNLMIGGNNLSTTFSGVIQNSGSLTKIGTGTLILSGANAYTGVSAVNAGTLLVSNTTGLATGTGAVKVNTGDLSGGGIIAGAVTIGTGSGAGAFLAPAAGGSKQATLTLQSSLIFQSDATYTYTFKAKKNKAKTDRVVANGVTINGGSFAFQGTAQGRLKQGLTFTAISNTAATPITGTFANLPDGVILTVNGNNFQASYEGGDGNDLTLTVVP
jgi:autotransporter-associated beta strand protein